MAQEPPREWTRALARAARSPWSSDAPPAAGEPGLRELLAAHTRRARGLACDRDDVVLVTGTGEALVLVALALRALADSAQGKGRQPRIGVEDPGYQEGAHALASAGAELVPIPVASDGVTAAALAAEPAPLDAVMLTPSHQFPLGGRLPAEERIAILDWARRAGAVIIEDDYDSEFRHTGPVLPAIAALDQRGSTVYVASLNKLLSPSLRVGVLVLPSGRPELRREILLARAAIGASVSAHTQHALAEFLSDGGLRRAIARNRREYGHRRELVLERLAAGGVTATGGDGGLHMVVELHGGRSASEVQRELAERGVRVETLADFASGSHSRNGITIGYAAESIPRLVAGLAVITEVIGSGAPEPR